MMGTRLHWVDGPWPGRLALAARPRGGDWLEDELTGWQHAGVHAVLSLLTTEEERDLDLEDEAVLARAHGMEFLSHPIPDLQVPLSESSLAHSLDQLDAILSAGNNAVIHCRQGVGRTGLVASCLLVMKGLDPELAVSRISANRGITVPETAEQRQWIDRFAAIAHIGR